MKRVLLVALVLAGCALPPPDQPAHYQRMGRFLGLVANCGCSDIGRDRMLAEYPRALGGRYTPDEVKAMRGYVDLGAHEKYENQFLICAEVCSQTCMVNAVAEPLGGRVTPGVPACLVSERDLHLTFGETGGDNWP
ncbi:hypothetical protein [Magnetospirillum sp. UT-4]|uniref:hypothetical protein n=1 Tax=Magnetospirillum sp. UT-4 TaxID=2681467 RepID=UPI0015731593|nr:hypothetical protein [Magnetospirillum sp. UT-4]